MGLDTVEFLLYAEKAFDIKISDEEAGNIATVGEFSALCHQKLAMKPNNNIDEEQVFLTLKQILRQHFSISNIEINRNHLIVKDLGLE